MNKLSQEDFEKFRACFSNNPTWNKYVKLQILRYSERRWIDYVKDMERKVQLEQRIIDIEMKGFQDVLDYVHFVKHTPAGLITNQVLEKRQY